MQPLFEAIINHVPPPPVELEGPLQLQVSSLDYNSYVGLMGIGRISRGVVKRNMPVTLVQRDGTERNAQLMELYGFEGLTRTSITEAGAGDIVVFSGIEDLQISDTVCARGQGEGLQPLQVDEPTITMTFQVNKSPFAGNGRQVPHEPPDSRASPARAPAQRRAACRRDGRRGQVPRVRPRRAAPLGADREHAP